MAAPEALVTKPLQKLGGKLAPGLFRGGKEGSARRKGGDHDSDVEDPEGSQALLSGSGQYDGGGSGSGPGGSSSGSGGGGGGKSPGRGWQPPSRSESP